MEQQLMNLIFNAPNYNTFKEIHDKYYNLLLGKVVPVSYKSLVFMFKDYVKGVLQVKASKIIPFEMSLFVNEDDRYFFKVKADSINFEKHYLIVMNYSGNNYEISGLLLDRIKILFYNV